jgi:hypothetical protein
MTPSDSGYIYDDNGKLWWDREVREKPFVIVMHANADPNESGQSRGYHVHEQTH